MPLPSGRRCPLRCPRRSSGDGPWGPCYRCATAAHGGCAQLRGVPSSSTWPTCSSAWRTPSRTQTALVAGARRLTFAELDARANRLAHALAAAGIAPGTASACSWPTAPSTSRPCSACFKVRAVPVNVNYRYVASELRYLYDDAGLVGLVFHGRFAPAVADALERLAPATPGPRGGRRRAAARAGRRLRGRAGRPGGRARVPGRGRPTTSTASTPAAPPGSPRASCGATRTSSSPPWAAATPSRSAMPSPLPRSWPGACCAPG